MVHHEQGNYAQALEYFRQSLDTERGNRRQSRNCRHAEQLGNVHHSQGNYAQALEYYQKSLALRKPWRQAWMPYAERIGDVHSYQSNYAQALHDLPAEPGNQRGHWRQSRNCRHANNIGMVHRLQGNYAQALETFQRSLALREAMGDKAGIATRAE